MSREFNYYRCDSCIYGANLYITLWFKLIELIIFYFCIRYIYIILHNVPDSILSWTVDTCEDSMRNLSTLSNSKPDNALIDINDVSIHRIILLQTLQRLVCHQLG